MGSKKKYFGSYIKEGEKMIKKLLVMILFLSLVAFAIDRTEAVNGIRLAELDVKEMSDAGFSIAYVNDTLTQAKQALQRADFADSVRKNESTPEARAALEGLDYQGFTYDEVLKYTNIIKDRKKQAYEIKDFIRALELKIDEYKNENLDIADSEKRLNDAKLSFSKDRYDESVLIINEINQFLDSQKSDAGKLLVLLSSGKNFIETNTLEFAILLLVIIAAVYLIIKFVRKKNLNDTIMKLEEEQRSIKTLMKSLQRERYEKGTISDFLYKLKLSNYDKKMKDISQRLPALKLQLKKDK